MTRAAPLAAAVVAALCAACAATGTFDPSPEDPGWARSPAGQPLAPQAALDTIAIGRSTKADGASALGKAIVIAFGSGYEVWVYRWPGADRSEAAATGVGGPVD